MKLMILPKSAKDAVALAIVATLVGGYIYRDVPCVGVAGAATNVASIPQEAPQKLFVALPDFAEIAARQGLAVVNISVSGTDKAESFGFPGFPQVDPNDSFYEIRALVCSGERTLGFFPLLVFCARDEYRHLFAVVV